MATSPVVRVARPVVGIEFDPSQFQSAVTPEIEIPTEFPTLKLTMRK